MESGARDIHQDQQLEDKIELVAEFYAQNDQSDKQSSDSDNDDKEICWICLDTGSEDNVLVAPCKCPRKAHAKCLARWQLQSAGSKEETHCRFCSHELPNWRSALTPQAKASKSPLVVTVCSNGQEHDICVDHTDANGIDGFQDHIRNLFGIQTNVQLKFTFYCTEPTTGDLITLEGAGAYNAAMHCASVSASKRARRPFQKTSHNRTTSSMAALGSDSSLDRPPSHARSRSQGSLSDSSSANSSPGDIPAHVMEMAEHQERLSELDGDESQDCSMQLSSDDSCSQVPLKKRLRALGKRMMRSLRINNQVA